MAAYSPSMEGSLLPPLPPPCFLPPPSTLPGHSGQRFRMTCHLSNMRSCSCTSGWRTQHPRLSILAPGNAGLFSVNPSSSFGPLLSLTDDSDNAAIGLLSEAAGPDLFLLRLFGFRRGGGGLSKGRKLRGVAELACLLVDVRRCRPKRSLLRLSPRRRQFHQLLLVLWTTRPRTRPSAGGAVIVSSVSAVLSVSSPSPHQYWPDIVKTSPSIGLEDSSDFRDRILRRNLPLLSRMTPRASSRCQPESKARGGEDKLEAQSGNN